MILSQESAPSSSTSWLRRSSEPGQSVLRKLPYRMTISFSLLLLEFLHGNSRLRKVDALKLPWPADVRSPRERARYVWWHDRAPATSLFALALCCCCCSFSCSPFHVIVQWIQGVKQPACGTYNGYIDAALYRGKRSSLTYSREMDVAVQIGLVRLK